jgi:hypothetical protein
VELHRERVVLRRSLAGMLMAINMPVSAFSGVAVRLVHDEGADALAVVLEHKDPLLAVTLFASTEADEAFAEWRTWANVLGLPLLVDDNGDLREPFPRLGGVRIGCVRARRRRHNAIRRRRPSLPMRRAPGKLTDTTPVYRGEREIIARN